MGNSKMGLSLVPHGIIRLNYVLYMSMVRNEDQVREMQKVRDNKSFPSSVRVMSYNTNLFLLRATPPPLPLLIFDPGTGCFFCKTVRMSYVQGLLVRRDTYCQVRVD
jgi:hypothetical protein